MNLLARILSHGFALAVVALIFLVLVYRGDLFQDTELPEFLTFKKQPVPTEEAGAGAVDRTIDETAVPAGNAAAPTESQQGHVAPAPVTVTSDDESSVNEMPAATESPAAAPDTAPYTTPETAAETAAVTEPVTAAETAAVTEPETSRELTPPASETPQVEDASEPAVTIELEEGTTQVTEGETVLTIEESVDQSRVLAEVPPAPAAEDSDEVAAELTVDTTVLTIDETVVEVSPAEETPLEAAVEEAAPEEPAPAALPQSAADTEPAVEPEPDTVPEEEDAAQLNAGTVAEAPYKILAKAREAFWLRDFEVAEQQYRKLTQLEPDNPDGYGELGNMYFSQGKWDEAAAAYYEAGSRLLQEGLIAEAREMLEVIRGLNGPQADDLEAQIAAATTSSP